MANYNMKNLTVQDIINLGVDVDDIRLEPYIFGDSCEYSDEYANEVFSFMEIGSDGKLYIAFY